MTALRKPVPNCPCCGQAVATMAELNWNEPARTLSGHGLAVVLSPLRGRMFSLLWQNFSTGRLVGKEKMMHELYSDDPDGGPNSDNIISVQVIHLRNQIKPFGISVKGRSGYALVVLSEDQVDRRISA